MMITLELDTVDLAQIAESGQCFRMAPLGVGSYRWADGWRRQDRGMRGESS